MPHVMVAASGPDQPGIVAEFTRVFVERDCNLEDTSMTVLRGHFAMMLVVEVPDATTPDSLEADLAHATAPFGLIVNVWEVGRLAAATVADGERWIVAIHGADRKGIVNAFAKVLAGDDVNIVEVHTRLEPEGSGASPDGTAEYAMELGVLVPDGLDAGALALELTATAQRLGVECSLSHDA